MAGDVLWLGFWRDLSITLPFASAHATGDTPLVPILRFAIEVCEFEQREIIRYVYRNLAREKMPAELP